MAGLAELAGFESSSTPVVNSQLKVRILEHCGEDVVLSFINIGAPFSNAKSVTYHGALTGRFASVSPRKHCGSKLRRAAAWRRVERAAKRFAMSVAALPLSRLPHLVEDLGRRARLVLR